jgi:hypothetical protein
VFTPHVVEMPPKRGTQRSQGLPPTDPETVASKKHMLERQASEEDIFDDPKKLRKKSPEIPEEEAGPSRRERPPTPGAQGMNMCELSNYSVLTLFHSVFYIMLGIDPESEMTKSPPGSQEAARGDLTKRQATVPEGHSAPNGGCHLLTPDTRGGGEVR